MLSRIEHNEMDLIKKSQGNQRMELRRFALFLLYLYVSPFFFVSFLAFSTLVKAQNSRKRVQQSQGPTRARSQCFFASNFVVHTQAHTYSETMLYKNNHSITITITNKKITKAEVKVASAKAKAKHESAV